MSKGLPYSNKRGVPQQQDMVKQTLRIKALPIQVDGASGVGFGVKMIGDFPQGNILFLGAVSYLQFTKAAGATGIQAAFDGDYSIGTTPTADATISGTDANIVGSTALGAATSGVSPVVRGTGVTAAIFDNTDGSLEINLNLIIDDANINADDQDLTVTGTLDLVYSVLGDD